MIDRLNEPYGWALPGGFVDLDESCEEALIREMKEEISVNITDIEFFQVRSKPGRDPRGPVVSIVYTANCFKLPKAADDAKNVKILKFEDDLNGFNFAFDHKDILLNFQK